MTLKRYAMFSDQRKGADPTPQLMEMPEFGELVRYKDVAEMEASVERLKVRCEMLDDILRLLELPDDDWFFAYHEIAVLKDKADQR